MFFLSKKENLKVLKPRESKSNEKLNIHSERQRVWVDFLYEQTLERSPVKSVTDATVAKVVVSKLSIENLMKFRSEKDPKRLCQGIPILPSKALAQFKRYTICFLHTVCIAKVFLINKPFIIFYEILG